MLDRKELKPPYPAVAAALGRLLFQSRHMLGRPWEALRLTAVLRQATAEVWGQPVKSQLYHQLSIGVAGKRVREVCQSFNRYDDGGATADRNAVHLAERASSDPTRSHSQRYCASTNGHRSACASFFISRAMPRPH
jgi:hypothetical protein